MDISENWMIGKAIAKEYSDSIEMKQIQKLCPISETEPEFAGIVRYEKKIRLDVNHQKAYVRAEHVQEVMRVTVNGKVVGTRLTPPYQMAIGEYMNKDENTLVIEVATTPARDQLNYPMRHLIFPMNLLRRQECTVQSNYS